MIKGTGIMFLDGDFHKSYPKPERFSYRNDKGEWFYVSRGPRYANVHQVSEFDDAGLKWLEANERSANDAPSIGKIEL